MSYDTNGTATSVWLGLLEVLMRSGQAASPRGMPVKELLAAQTGFSMRYPVVRVPGRKLGWRFLAAEAWWILTGRDDVASIAPYSKDIANFSDDGVKFFGAYGPKVVPQLDYVVSKLIEDPDSRQAVISIWREAPGPTKDVPCTLSLQFLTRDRKLHCVATMRSSDAWLGWVYDVFNFTMISAMVLLKLRSRVGVHPADDSLASRFPSAGLGNLYMTMGSSHLYERNWEAVGRILEQRPTKWPPAAPPFEPLALWSNGVELLPVDLKCAADDDGGGASPFVAWFRAQRVV